MDLNWMLLVGIGVVWVLSLVIAFFVGNKSKHKALLYFEKGVTLLQENIFNVKEFLIFCEIIDYDLIVEKIEEYEAETDQRKRDELSFWFIKSGLMDILRYDAMNSYGGVAMARDGKKLLDHIEDTVDFSKESLLYPSITNKFFNDIRKAFNSE